MNPERLIGMMAPRSPRMDSGGPSGAPPEWTAEDAAHAAAGLSRPAWLAFCYRWAIDGTSQAELRRELLRAAWSIARREEWPPTWNGAPYLPKYVDLAIYEEHHDLKPLADNVKGFLLYPAILGWPDHAWTLAAAQRYSAVKNVLDEWNHDAHRHIAGRIRDPELEGLATGEK